MMKSHKVTGGGGVQLHLVEAGNPGGRPVLFIHGFFQCWQAWSRQLSSELAWLSGIALGLVIHAALLLAFDLVAEPRGAATAESSKPCPYASLG
jgi:pimeloyl-ACP methyl ester carboxylesterase